MRHIEKNEIKTCAELNDVKGSVQDQVLLYQSEDGHIKLNVRLEGETVWLTQKLMAELFQVTTPTINEHISNIYNEGELIREATIRKSRIVQTEGQREVAREIELYNLDMILSVGYRVKSLVATRFRIWATERLREYIVKGFAIDDQRLKEDPNSRYFEELLERIRDIRSSKKVFWRKVLDIYATSIDYDRKSEQAQTFFKKVQNQLHWAAHGHTAAELIYQRANSEQDNMGVTNYPGNKLLKRDVEVAKNYLKENELALLNRIVTAYLEMAELQAMSQISMTMQDWTDRLHQFLTMTGRDILTHAGKISHDAALKKAHEEYEKLKRKSLEMPSAAEKDFIAAERAFKQLDVEKSKDL